MKPTESEYQVEVGSNILTKDLQQMVNCILDDLEEVITGHAEELTVTDEKVNEFYSATITATGQLFVNRVSQIVFLMEREKREEFLNDVLKGIKNSIEQKVNLVEAAH